MLFSILSGADSYRSIETFVKINFKKLKKLFKLKWKKAPCYTSIRYIIMGIKTEDLETAFREYSLELVKENNNDKKRFIAIDGKVLKGSFDNFKDKKAIQILSAFLVNESIILAHEEVSHKTNEIPVSQKLITDFGFENCIFTFDALHCQKNFRNFN